MDGIDEHIIEEAAQGDVRAFERIYREYFRFVSNVALRVVRTREDAQEVVQEVFMTVYRNLKGFRHESSLKTWMYRVTINCAINYSKKMAKDRNRKAELTETISGDISDLHTNLEKEHNERVVQSLLAALNPQQKACIVLRSIEGLSYQEIAETLKIPINTVRSRIKRARETMLALKKEVVHNEM